MKRSYVVTAIITILICVFVLFAAIAHSHSWYDSDCCGGNDCEPVTVMTDHGGNYAILKNGNKWYIDHPRTRRPSQDDNYHVCIHQNMVWCLYIPTQG